MTTSAISPERVRLLSEIGQLAEIELARRGRSRLSAGKAESSLHSFTRQAWRIIEPFTRFIPGWHIDAICEHLQAVSEGKIKKLIITVPPGHMKSLTTCVTWQAWDWLANPWLRWMFASYSSALSIRDHNKARMLMDSGWYRGNWGSRFLLTKANDHHIENSKTGFRIASSVGGLGTGERVHRNVNDDLLRANDAHSEAMREQAIAHLRAMATRAVDPAAYGQVLIMQRLHQQDPAGWLMETEKDWEHLRLPAEFEGKKNRTRTSIGWEDPRQVEGELLWPAMYPVPEIVKLKTSLGSYGAAGQLQQNPAPLEGGVIKRAWWQRFPADQRPALFDTIIISGDLAFKEYETSSKVALHVWGRAGRFRYLVDRICRNMGIVETISSIRELHSRWHRFDLGLRIDAVLIEDKANGPAVIEVLQKELANVIAIEPRGSKIARALAVAPQIEAGSVYVQAEPWGDEVVDAWSFVPNGDNWDDVDAASQALDHLSVYEIPSGSIISVDMESARHGLLQIN